MATASSTPDSAASAARRRKLPWRSTTRSPNRANRRPARPSASRSASSPSRRTRSPLASRSRSECPPMPTVPSTTQPGWRGRRRNVTSSASTGRCASSFRSGSDTLLRQPRARLVQRGSAARVAIEVRPPLEIPDLEHPLHPDDHDVLDEARALAIVRGDLDAPLRIEHDVLAEREVAVPELPRVGIERGQVLELDLELLPRLQRIHVKSLVVARHHAHPAAPATREDFPKARRDAQSALRVDRVPVMPPNQSRHSRMGWDRQNPFSSTSWDFIPLDRYPRSWPKTCQGKNPRISSKISVRSLHR